MACVPNQNHVAVVELTVNGEKVELNDFVQGFISQTVIGMAGSLRGVDNIETIDLKISTKA